MYIVLILGNVIYYAGTFGVFLFDSIGLDGPIWLAIYAAFIVGLLFSGVTDPIVNIGLAELDINKMRLSAASKGVIFLTVFTSYRWNTQYALCLIYLLFAIDCYAQVKLVSDIRATGITIPEFLDAINNFDTSEFDSIKKCLIAIMIGTGLIYALKDTNVYVITVMLLLNLIIHVVSFGKIIKLIDNKRRLAGCLLWVLYILMCVFSLTDDPMLACFFYGTYWMICVDSITKSKTAIFK